MLEWINIEPEHHRYVIFTLIKHLPNAPMHCDASVIIVSQHTKDKLYRIVTTIELRYDTLDTLTPSHRPRLIMFVRLSLCAVSVWPTSSKRSDGSDIKIQLVDVLTKEQRFQT